MQKILSRVIFIGFSIQIMLGILWMGNAFTRLDNSGEGVFCVILTVLTGAVMYFVKRSIWGAWNLWKECFVILSILTFPFVMQMLLNPDYRLGIMLIVLLALGVVLRFVSKMKEVKKILIVFGFGFLVVGVVIGIESINQGWTPMNIRMTERVAWTTLYKSYERIPREKRVNVNYEEFAGSTHDVLGVREVLAPGLVKDLGEEEAERFLAELRDLSWEYEKKQVVKEIIWDAAGYTLSPVILPLQLEGRAYESYAGKNYRELLMPHPRLGKIYTMYSCWCFSISLVLSGLIWGENRIRRKWKVNWLTLLIIVAAQAGMILWYTMDGAGKMDYKNTIFVLCMWLLCVTGTAMRSLAEEQIGGIQNEKE